jgi:hypothetical protein
MDALKKVVEQIKANLVDIEAEIVRAEEKGFVYARSKEIRKSAQAIKIAAQDLREVTTIEFKKTQEK